VAVSNVELRVGATQAITALKNVNTQAQKFNQTVNGTNSKLRDANKNLPILGKGFFGAGASAKTAAAGIRTAGAALQSALLPILGITTAVAALGKTFGVIAQQDFASAKIKTLGVDADALNPKLESLSNQLSGQVSQLDLLSASYDVASAGFGEVAELTDVLKASQLGATGGFSELATVADATTSVLNAYGMSSDKAAKLVDGFIQTQNDGKIVVDQYAQQIGRLAPIAAGAGVGIDELNAAISTVTATGVPVESTFAGLRQVIASIQKPTSEAAKAAEKLGIDFSATALSTKGLGGVLQEVVDKGGASEETLALLFGSVEARTAVLPLLNDQLVSFNKNLDNQAKAQGTAARAAFTASNTIQGQLTRLGTAFTNLASEGSDFGVVIREVFKIAAVTVEALGLAFKVVGGIVKGVFSAVNEVAKAIAEAIGIDATNIVFDLEQSWIGVKEGVTEFSNAVVAVGKTVGTIVGRILKAVIGVFQKINQVVNDNKVLRFIFGITKVPTLKINVETNLESVDKLKEGVEDTSTATNNIVKKNKELTPILQKNKQTIDGQNESLDEQGEKVDVIKDKVDTNNGKTEEGNEELDEQKEIIKEIGDALEDNLKKELKEAVKGAQSFGDAMKNVLSSIKDKLIDLAINKIFDGLSADFQSLASQISNTSVQQGGSGGGGGGGGGGVKFGSIIGGAIGGPVGAAIGSFLPFAEGGKPPVGKPSIVGEKGPELFVPRSAGTIIPNNQMGGDVVVNVSVDASGSSISGSDQKGNQFGQELAVVIQQEIIRQKRSGGLLA